MHEIDTQKNKNNVETQNVTWKTHNVGKTTAAHMLQKIPLYERNILSRKCRGNNPSSSFSPHAAAVTQRRQRPLSISLTRSTTLSAHLTLQLFNNTSKTCALSRIYTYTTFRRIYIPVLPIGSVPIGAGSAESRFSASSIQRDIFPTNSPFTPAWNVAPIRSAFGMLAACRGSAP